MGLIKAVTDSASQVVGDQFKEFVTMPQVDDRALVIRGIVNHGDANKGATEGIISNGSKIAVPEGYAMMIIENGAIKEFSAEAGEFIWDTSSEPSVFEGGFFKGIGDSIKRIGDRITYGGQPAKDQRVYYINIKKVMNNHFGSQQPVTIQDPIYESIEITFNGDYSFKVVDPTVLVAEVIGGNASDIVTADEVVGGQLKTQFSSNVSTCISNLLIQNNISFNAVQGYKNEVVNVMNTLLDESWTKQYGLTILDVALNINASEESKQIIRNIDSQIAMGQAYAANPNGMMAAATGTAMQNAASNPNGAMNGFVGLNMAQGVGGNAINAANQAPAQSMPQGSIPNPGEVSINQTTPNYPGSENQQ
jgi:membrane protease subunit (stomatin/prohibitin family)